MDLLNTFASLFSNFGNLTWQMVVMWGIGALLIYLAIAKKMEPSLLLPMGFGAIRSTCPCRVPSPRGRPSAPFRPCLRRACPTSCSRCCSSSALVP